MAAATTDEHESHGTHMGFTGICSLCDYQFTSNATAFGSYAKSSLESDSSGGSEPDAEDALRVFLADKNERSVRLVLCRSCREQLDQLLETGRQLSLLVDLVTTLLLQNSRFTLIHPKETIIAKLFSDNNLQQYFSSSSSRLHGLDPLSTKDVDLEPESYQMKNSVSLTDNMSDIDREIHELETQFHLDRIKVYKYQEGHLQSEDDHQIENPSLCSSLPSLVSLDSCSFAQKDPLGNNIMNVNISALESSGSNGFGHNSLSKPPKAKTSPIKNHTSITNLIANTTNDELDVCFSNRIQKMKESNTEEASDERSKRVENVFRLPLPPSTASAPPESKTDKSRKTVKKVTREHKKVKKRFACEMCPKTWDSKRDLDVHVGSHLKVSNFVCEICGMAYRHKSALKTHVALHQGEAKYKCDKCQKHFTQKSGLERHEEAIHSSARKYECTDCGRTFRYHSSFNLHKQYHKETPNKKFRCQIGQCVQSFFTSYHLKRHLKTHASDTPQKCQVKDSSVNSNSEANNFCETSAQ